MPGKARIGAHDLGIDPGSDDDAELFRWFVACQLFGARISQEIAAAAFKELDAAGFTTPRGLAEAGWQSVVDALGRGGYRRYDESTARELIQMGKDLIERYGGSMRSLHDAAESKADLRRKLQEFKGIGPTSCRIFLREAPWT